MRRGPTLSAVLLAVVVGLVLVALFGGNEPGPGRSGGPASIEDAHGVPRSGDQPGSTTKDRSAARTAVVSGEAGPSTENDSDAPPDAGGTVTVRTVFADGAPVPWVLVDLVRPRTSGYRAGEALEVTDEAGEARFDGVDSGDWVARTDRFRERAFDVPAGGSVEVEITLRRGVEIHGVVVDPAGVPVAGAEIWRGPTRSDRETHRIEARSAPVTRSGPDGSFHLPGFGPEPVWAWLAARHSGFAASAWTGVGYQGFYTAAPERLVLRLRAPTHSIAGTVRAAQGGAGLAGARIEIEPVGAERQQQPDGGTLDFDHALATVTAADGTFRLPNLVAGTWSLRASARGHAPGLQEVVLEEGVVVPPVEFRLENASRIALRVVDPDGAPVVGVDCTLTAGRGTRPAGRTDREGRCSFADLPAGAARVLLEKSGFRRRREDITAEQVAAGEELVYVLEPRPRLLGRLLDASGTALAGWQVAARREPREPAGQTEWLGAAPTDASGSFALDLDDPAPVQLTAAPLAGLSVPVPLADDRPVVPSPEPTDFVVPTTAPRGGAVTARVAAGRRPWFTLMFVREGRPAGQRADEAIQAGYSIDRQEFRLAPLLPGDYLLQVLVDPAEGRSPFRRGLAFQSEVFTVVEGGTVDLGVLAPPPHGRLSWVLRPGRGCEPREPRIQWAPVAGAPSESGLQILDPRLRDGVLAGDLPLLPGSYEATFWGEGFLSETRTVEIAADRATDLDLVLHAAQRLPLRLELPEGVDRADFEFRDARGVLVHEDGFEDGEARVVVRYPVLPLGMLDVRVTSGERVWTGRLEVKSLTPTREALGFGLELVR